MFEVCSSSRLRGGILCFVLLLLCCFAWGEKCAIEGGSRRKCGGRHYKLTLHMARAAELPSGHISLPCPLGRNKTAKQKMLGSSSISFTMHQKATYSQQTSPSFRRCWEGYRRIFPWYKVVYRMFNKNWQRSDVYFASQIYTARLVQGKVESINNEQN